MHFSVSRIVVDYHFRKRDRHTCRQLASIKRRVQGTAMHARRRQSARQYIIVYTQAGTKSTLLSARIALPPT
jgi:hypothetical protein